MLRNKRIFILTVIMILLAAAWVSASNTVDQKGVLGGKVLAANMVKQGAAVHEGDVLIMVETITGSAPAVRANVDGKVVEVLVRPGDIVHTGDILVRIEPVQK